MSVRLHALVLPSVVRFVEVVWNATCPGSGGWEMKKLILTGHQVSVRKTRFQRATLEHHGYS